MNEHGRTVWTQSARTHARRAFVLLCSSLLSMSTCSNVVFSQGEAAYDREIREWSDAIRQDPKNAANYWRRAEARWRKARALKANDEYQAGVADCDQAIALDLKDPWAYFVRGKCRHTDFSGAIDDFNQAIRLKPDFAAAYGARGATWLENARFTAIFSGPQAAGKQYERALADLSEALRLEPNDAGARGIRGNVWAEKRDYPKAIADYREAVRLEPSNPEYRISLADALRASGQYDIAITAYSDVLRLDPENREALEHRGDACLAVGQYDRAAADYTQAGALVKRREAWRAAGQYGKLLDDLGEAIRENPKGFVAHEQIARLFAACPDAKYRDGKKAVEHATTACELMNWKNRVTLATLAAAYAESGDFQQAIEWQSKAIELGGARKEINDYRQRLELYKQGKPYREAPTAEATDGKRP